MRLATPATFALPSEEVRLRSPFGPQSPHEGTRTSSRGHAPQQPTPMSTWPSFFTFASCIGPPSSARMGGHEVSGRKRVGRSGRHPRRTCFHGRRSGQRRLERGRRRLLRRRAAPPFARAPGESRAECSAALELTFASDSGGRSQCLPAGRRRRVTSPSRKTAKTPAPSRWRGDRSWFPALRVRRSSVADVASLRSVRRTACRVACRGLTVRSFGQRRRRWPRIGRGSMRAPSSSRRPTLPGRPSRRPGRRFTRTSASASPLAVRWSRGFTEDSARSISLSTTLWGPGPSCQASATASFARGSTGR